MSWWNCGGSVEAVPNRGRAVHWPYRETAALVMNSILGDSPCTNSFLRRRPWSASRPGCAPVRFDAQPARCLPDRWFRRARAMSGSNPGHG